MNAKIDTIFGDAVVNDVMIDTDGTNLADGVEIKINGVVIAEIIGKTAEELKRLPVQEIEDLIDSHIS